MTYSLQRLSGLVALALAALLCVLNVTWLVPTSPAENPRAAAFLPVKHELLSIQVGPAVLELSRSQASHIVMVVSVFLIIVGGLLFWRSVKVRHG
jgi:hypothetical protein